ncbi:MAG: polysaccharide biosynthesis/export family protein [Kiritimatiellia bacterium]|jgi:protein involved in polysaccharide export with SLBB domain|nr:polysaccharide biosynthesis/export family protein [Kiritimatiellia bacterium]MDP6630025.1 polysaccharide biosynthesis/export family protein [Kiritimatiellia bacterium]MDP6810970.1 polysaccharide biosynthesis/export family protein [Kiritimatiellia bacterium]MDP7025231.1 polysaccharide biosynthesis/export family protein [Kiritimatiellia bacterium]
MKVWSLMSIMGVMLITVGLVGCATNDYDLDIDALLQQLEMEAGIDYPAAPTSTPSSPAMLAPPSAAVTVAAPPVTVVPSPVQPAERNPGVAAPPAQPAQVPVQPAQPPAPTPPGEITIQPDCLVQISVAEDPALNGSYPVNEIGAVKLGYVGPVILYNKTESQAAEKIRDILTSRHFRNATVQVRIIRASYDKVRVGGEVMSPGMIKIGAGDIITLNDALLRVGGLRPAAKGAKVKIVRNGLRKATALAETGEVYTLSDEAGNPAVPEVSLYNNDVAYVFIPAGDSDVPVAAGGGSRRVILLGSVRQPGVYTFKRGQPCTMMHLMFRVSGQLSPYANKKKVRVIRKNEKGWEEEFRVDVGRLLKDGDPAADIPLQDGDRIVVPKRRITLF